MKDEIRAYIRSHDKPGTLDVCTALSSYSAKSIVKGIHTLQNCGKIRKVIHGQTFYWENIDVKYYTT